MYSICALRQGLYAHHRTLQECNPPRAWHAMCCIVPGTAVRRASTLVGTSSGVANRTTEFAPAASKSATGIQSCAKQRETMSAFSLDQH